MSFDTILTQEVVDRFTSEGFWVDKTITDFLDEAAERVPGKVACWPRGPFLFVGYAKRVEATRSQLTGDGWLDTGDLAILDADGYFTISGRTKDVIIRGGENIPVAYVENVLYENHDFESVAVVAIPDARLQERAGACIVMAEGAAAPTLADLQHDLKGKGVAKEYWARERAYRRLPSGHRERQEPEVPAARAHRGRVVTRVTAYLMPDPEGSQVGEP